MRKILFRAAAITAGLALATLTLPAGTAGAASSATCDPATSVKLLTTSLLESADNRIWVQSLSATRTIVCFDIPFGSVGGGAIVVDAYSGGTLPSATLGGNQADCGAQVLGQTDPVAFRIAVDIPKSMVCLTVASQTVTLAFAKGTPGTPAIQIWRDGTFSWIDVAACPVEYLLWSVAEGPETCMVTNARIY